MTARTGTPLLEPELLPATADVPAGTTSAAPKQESSARLRRMKFLAGALLAAATAIFALTLLGSGHGWNGFLRAAAEGAMVGGLADWFAVTALFRRPLGLPIPHTALIPRQKAQLATALGGYVTSNFLTSEVVGGFLARSSPGARAAAWVLADDHAQLVARQAGSIAASALENVSEQSFVEVSLAAARRSHGQGPLSPLAGRLLQAVVAERTHEPVVQLLLAEAHAAVSEHRLALSDWLFDTVEPSNIGTRLFVSPGTARGWVKKAQTELQKAQEDRDHFVHPLIEDFLDRLSRDLLDSHQLGQQFDQKIAQLLADDAVAAWLADVTSLLLSSAKRELVEPAGSFVTHAAETLKDAAQRVADDEKFAQRLEGWLQGAAQSVLDKNASFFINLVEDVVGQLDGQVVARQIEQAAGRDLQYIRINGTVVGALAAVAIHAIALMAT